MKRSKIVCKLDESLYWVESDTHMDGDLRSLLLETLRAARKKLGKRKPSAFTRSLDRST